MASFMQMYVALAAFIVLAAAAPAAQSGNQAVLKDQPLEVLFKADNYSTALLECALENEEKGVKYSWHKNGAPFDWQAAGHIGQRPGEGSIMFFNPQPSDEAIYQCFAKTSYGTASTRPISLKQTFIEHPKVELKEHKPVYGKHYKLDCAIPKSYPKPTIVWKKQTLADPSKSEEILNRRITISPDGNLWFTNITDEDVSPGVKYVCVAKTPAEKKEVVLAEHLIKETVENKEPTGELVPQYVSNDMVGKAGEVTMIYCIFGGTPTAIPDYFKDGKDVNGDEPGSRVTRHSRTAGKRLLIKDTFLSDQGTYSCVLDNGVGKQQKHSMVLTVVSAPKLEKKPEKQIVSSAGSDVSIPCKVTGKPEPKVTWTYNAKPIENPSVKDGVLTLKQVKKSDTGYYGCKAVNEHGDLYVESLLQVN